MTKEQIETEARADPPRRPTQKESVIWYID